MIQVQMDVIQTAIDLQNLKSKNRKRIWKPLMEKYGCQLICELGVREGENFDLMIEHRPKEALAVDAWIDDGVSSRNDLGFPQEILDSQYKNFSKRMADKPFVKICRQYTFEAVKHFPDEYFDLIYIDADHTYEGCLRDIMDWFPKVKKGKFLTGDDYFINGMVPKTGVRFGVVEAVKEFVKDSNLKVYGMPLFGWAIIKP